MIWAAVVCSAATQEIPGARPELNQSFRDPDVEDFVERFESESREVSTKRDQVLEAIDLCEQISGRRIDWRLDEHARIGDHKWWISDIRPFQADYPEWTPAYGLRDMLREIHDANVERWLTRA